MYVRGYLQGSENGRVVTIVVEKELLTLQGHLSSPRFLWVRVTRSLVLCVCFVDRCLSFYAF